MVTDVGSAVRRCQARVNAASVYIVFGPFAVSGPPEIELDCATGSCKSSRVSHYLRIMICGIQLTQLTVPERTVELEM
jgi:hypothetical protein